MQEDRDTVRPKRVRSNEKEQDFGQETVRTPKVEEKPSEEEVEHHNVTHIPYRSWCKHCIMGKGKTRDHKRLKSRRRGMTTISMDYGFMSNTRNEDDEELEASPKEEQGQEGDMPILVGHDSQTGSIFAHIVPKKGEHPWAAKRTSQSIGVWGLPGMVHQDRWRTCNSDTKGANKKGSHAAGRKSTLGRSSTRRVTDKRIC